MSHNPISTIQIIFCSMPRSFCKSRERQNNNHVYSLAILHTQPLDRSRANKSNRDKAPYSTSSSPILSHPPCPHSLNQPPSIIYRIPAPHHINASTIRRLKLVIHSPLCVRHPSSFPLLPFRPHTHLSCHGLCKPSCAPRPRSFVSRDGTDMVDDQKFAIPIRQPVSLPAC